jgi:hypothetical protein
MCIGIYHIDLVCARTASKQACLKNKTTIFLYKEKWYRLPLTLLKNKNQKCFLTMYKRSEEGASGAQHEFKV